MGPGIGVHEHRIARTAHEVRHALVGDIGVGGLCIPLPDGNSLAPLAEGVELFAEAIKFLVGIQVHGLKGVDDLSAFIHSEADGNGFILLVHIVIFDLLLCQQLAVQRHRHFPGTFPECQLQPGGFGGEEQIPFFYCDAFHAGKVKDLIVQPGLRHVGIHPQPEGSFADKGDLHKSLLFPVSADLKGYPVGFWLVCGHIVQKIFRALVAVMAPAFFHMQHIAAHDGMIALNIRLFDLDHRNLSFLENAVFTSLLCFAQCCQGRNFVFGAGNHLHF